MAMLFSRIVLLQWPFPCGQRCSHNLQATSLGTRYTAHCTPDNLALSSNIQVDVLDNFMALYHEQSILRVLTRCSKMVKRSSLVEYAITPLQSRHS